MAETRLILSGDALTTTSAITTGDMTITYSKGVQSWVQPKKEPTVPTRSGHYECEGCDAVFEGTPEEAFHAGWDTPETFMSHCTCPNCPITVTLWWKIICWRRDHDDPFPATRQQAELLHYYNYIYEGFHGEEKHRDPDLG